MTTFCDKLLEAPGFENHVLVKKLAESIRQSMTGRLPAIGKKRTGPIDVALRAMPKIIDRLKLDVGADNIKLSSLSIVDWDIIGVGEGKDKKTLSFRLWSELFTIMGKSTEERPLFEMCLMDHRPRTEKLVGAGFTMTLEDLDDPDNFEVTRNGQHPIASIASEIFNALMLDKDCKFLGQEGREWPTTQYFSYGTEEPQYFFLWFDPGLLEEDLTEILGAATE